MGDWYGSPYRTQETTGAPSRNELLALPYCPSPTVRKPDNSRKGEVWGVDKGLLMGDTFPAAAVNVFWLAEGCRWLAVKWNRLADRCRRLD